MPSAVIERKVPTDIKCKGGLPYWGQLVSLKETLELFSGSKHASV
jgi:hypothetical protein